MRGRELEAEVEQVLAQPQRTKPRRLVELIAEINPTGRELQARDAARRYALKSRLDPSGLAATWREHFHHVLGCALFQLGDAEGARKAWEAGLPPDGKSWSCRLDLCLEVVAPSQRPSLVRELIAAIETADRCLARSDHQGARRTLWRRAVLGAKEVQSMARLATAWVNEEPQDDVTWFRKLFALTVFCEIHDHDAADFSLARELAVPGLHWDHDRLKALSDQAGAWIEAASRDFGPSPAVGDEAAQSEDTDTSPPGSAD